MRVSIIAAITIDGKIGRSSKDFPGWTGQADKKMFSLVTKKAGVVIMGSKTFDVIGGPLKNRLNIIMTRNKWKSSKQKNVIFTSNSALDIISHLKKKGYKDVFICGGAEINYLFVNNRLVDDLIITFSPITFGKGINLFSDNICLKLRLKSVKIMDSNSINAVYNILK